MSIGNVELAAGSQANTTSTLKAFLARYFYLCMSLVLAGLVLWGFSRTVDNNLFHAKPARPLLLWMHGAAFSTWIVFFIAQSALVRVRKVSVHRALGWFGAALAGTMVVLGIAVTLVMTRFDVIVLGQKGAEAFVSVPFFDMIAFGTLMSLAIYWRKKPEYHRRLVFIASCGLMDAAIGRFDFIFAHGLFFLGIDLLILLGVARDLIVDGRIGTVYRYALPAIIVTQNIALYLWRANPAWWQAITRTIVS